MNTNYAQTMPPTNEASNRPLPPELQPVKGNMPINLGSSGMTTSINPLSQPPPGVNGVLINTRPEHITDYNHATAPPLNTATAQAPAPNPAMQRNIAIIEQKMHEIANAANATNQRLVVGALVVGAIALGLAIYSLAGKKSKPVSIEA